MITILSLNSPFVNLYAGYPFFDDKKNQFKIVNSVEKALKQKTSCLILVRWFGDSDKRTLDQKIEELKILRNNFQKIIFADTEDSASSNLFFVLPYVDQYWKKQIYKDRLDYLKPLYGNRLFSDFYHEKFKINDNYVPYPAFGDKENLKKLKVSWNLGIGSYPVRYIREKLSDTLYQIGGPKLSLIPFAKPKLRKRPKQELQMCHAHFSGNGYTASIGYQRDLFCKILENKENVLRGFVKRSVFEKEMRTAAAVLSPFGWGEVCYRDFEAFMNGAVLIKPDMGHLDTWPEVYKPWETYVPVAWDGSDLIENINRVLEMSQTERLQICQNAWETWNRSFQELPMRLEKLLEDL